MSGRYERVRGCDDHRSETIVHQNQEGGLTNPPFSQVNAQDDDDTVTTPTADRPGPYPVPNSPPPSFHSRTSSSTLRNRQVQDPTLADAFDADDSDSDDEPDDRQRLVRQNSDPLQAASSSQHLISPTDGSGANTPGSPELQATATASRSNRIVGSGIQSDGVFTNLTAKPERGGTEKEEQPPVRCSLPKFSPSTSVV